MSNEQFIIKERSRDIGNFMVGRLLPFRKKSMIGPFVFVDHMGPATIKPENTMSVNQHPHIGLATLTYLLKGAILHADSMGTVQEIKAGEVNVMIAGRGVTHTERTPERLKKVAYEMEGYQIWIALAKEEEDREPAFHHLKKNEVPFWTENDLTYRLIVGTALGRTSKLPLWSNLFLLEIRNTQEAELDLGQDLDGEIGILVNQGGIEAGGESIGAGNLLVAKHRDQCSIRVQPNSILFVLGGQPFEEKRYIDWNFVSSDLDKIKQARTDWIERKFPQVPNDNTYVPYPKRRLRFKK